MTTFLIVCICILACTYLTVGILLRRAYLRLWLEETVRDWHWQGRWPNRYMGWCYFPEEPSRKLKLLDWSGCDFIQGHVHSLADDGLLDASLYVAGWPLILLENWSDLSERRHRLGYWSKDDVPPAEEGYVLFALNEDSWPYGKGRHRIMKRRSDPPPPIPPRRPKYLRLIVSR